MSAQEPSIPAAESRASGTLQQERHATSVEGVELTYRRFLEWLDAVTNHHLVLQDDYSYLAHRLEREYPTDSCLQNEEQWHRKSEATDLAILALVDRHRATFRAQPGYAPHGAWLPLFRALAGTWSEFGEQLGAPFVQRQVLDGKYVHVRIGKPGAPPPAAPGVLKLPPNYLPICIYADTWLATAEDVQEAVRRALPDIRRRLTGSRLEPARGTVYEFGRHGHLFGKWLEHGGWAPGRPCPVDTEEQRRAFVLALCSGRIPASPVWERKINPTMARRMVDNMLGWMQPRIGRVGAYTDTHEQWWSALMGKKWSRDELADLWDKRDEPEPDVDEVAF